MRLLLVGYGKMGQLVAQLAREFGGEVVGVVDPQSDASTGTIDDPRWDSVDVAIDFSSPNAVVHNVPSLARRRINIVLGTTGWQAHHAAKKDAPSGTALKLKRAMEEAGYHRPVDVAASRAGFIPGTHTIGFDGPSESITLIHTARDRGGFARGALTAARWIKGRRGWFTMEDVLGLTT